MLKYFVESVDVFHSSLVSSLVENDLLTLHFLAAAGCAGSDQ